jgi:hypothetical protein
MSAAKIVGANHPSSRFMNNGKLAPVERLEANYGILSG